MSNVIKIVRVVRLEIKFDSNGNKTLVPKRTIEREQDISNYDINYDHNNQKYFVARGW